MPAIASAAQSPQRLVIELVELCFSVPTSVAPISNGELLGNWILPSPCAQIGLSGPGYHTTVHQSTAAEQSTGGSASAQSR